MDRQWRSRFSGELLEQQHYGYGRSRRTAAPKWIFGELHRRQSAVRLAATSRERRQLDLSFLANLSDKTSVRRPHRGIQLYLVESDRQFRGWKCQHGRHHYQRTRSSESEFAEGAVDFPPHARVESPRHLATAVWSQPVDAGQCPNLGSSAC